MKIIPAVDIKNGKSVRLYQGKAETAKIYYENPLEAAKVFDSAGAEIIHIVDLDAAMALGENSDIILKISKNVNAKIEVGGGIRKLEIAKKYLDNSIERIVMGTTVFTEPNLVSNLIKEYNKERIVAAIDHLKGKVKIKGWLESTNRDLIDYIKFVEEIGVGYILLSSIEGDGTLMGPDYKIIKKVHDISKVPVIAAGGISSLNDLIKLKNINIYGVIIGRAFYEKKFDFKEALKVVGGQKT